MTRRTLRSNRTTALTALAAAAVLALSACSGGGGGKVKSATSPTPAPSTAGSTPAPPVTSIATSPAAALVDPLTGGKVSKNGVVAVKIDDTGNGRPQANIDKADIVYIEQVEGGLTRLLAVYHSSLPTVEAVRSTRASDPELIGAYGDIAYVASGGAHNPLYVLDHTKLKTSINDRGGPGFRRDPNRAAPYNLQANLATIVAKLKPPTARNIGLTWSPSTTQAGHAPSGYHVRTTVGATGIAFDYDTKTHRYDRRIGGAIQHETDGAVISATNVLVQFCSVTVYTKDIDVNGNPSKYTHSIGSGKAVLFRNGHAVSGTWKRTSYGSPTSYLDASGKPLLFAPGNLWVVLVATGTKLG